MNAIACFLVAFLASVYSKDEELVFLNDTNAVECRNEYDLNEDDMTELLTGNYPDNEEAKCFVKCWYEKSGFVNEEGDILEDAIRSFVIPFEKSDAFIKQLEECKDDKVETCENAYDFDKCLMKAVEM